MFGGGRSLKDTATIPLLASNNQGKLKVPTLVVQSVDDLLLHAKELEKIFALKETFASKCDKFNAYFKAHSEFQTSINNCIQYLPSVDLEEIQSIDSFVGKLNEIHKIFQKIKDSIDLNAKLSEEKDEATSLGTKLHSFIIIYQKVLPRLQAVSKPPVELENEAKVTAIPEGRMLSAVEIIAQFQSIAVDLTDRIETIKNLRNSNTLLNNVLNALSSIYTPLSDIPIQTHNTKIQTLIDKLKNLYNQLALKECPEFRKPHFEKLFALSNTFGAVGTNAGNCARLIESLPVASIAKGGAKQTLITSINNLSDFCHDLSQYFLTGTVGFKSVKIKKIGS